MATCGEVFRSPQSTLDDDTILKSVVLTDTDSEDESPSPVASNGQGDCAIGPVGEAQMMIQNASAPVNVGGEHVTTHNSRQKTFVETQHIYYMCPEREGAERSESELREEAPPAGGTALRENGKYASLLAVSTISVAVLAALVALCFGGGAATSVAAGLMSAGLTMALASLVMAVFGLAGTAVIVATGGAVGAVIGCLLAKLITIKADDDAAGETKQKEREAGTPVFHQDVAVAAASSVTAGVSLTRTSAHALLNDGYCVTCVCKVENWLGVSLISPYVQLSGGVMTMPPSAIMPATREAMVTRKYSGTATGTCGTASWLLQGFDRRLVIMWSAPYNFDFYMNWLAVGLTAPGVTEHAADDAWFNQMYYYRNTEELQFQRQEYYYNVHPVFFRDATLEVEGIMTSAHKATVKVILRPVNKDNLAACIKDNMLTRSPPETTPVDKLADNAEAKDALKTSL